MAVDVKIIPHDRPGLTGEPVRVRTGHTKQTDMGNGQFLCEWFDEKGRKTDEYWIMVRRA